jgi:hypothetical protein
MDGELDEEVDDEEGDVEKEDLGRLGDLDDEDEDEDEEAGGGLLVKLDERRAGVSKSSSAMAAQWFSQELFDDSNIDEEDMEEEKEEEEHEGGSDGQAHRKGSTNGISGTASVASKKDQTGSKELLKASQAVHSTGDGYEIVPQKKDDSSGSETDSEDEYDLLDDQVR